MRGGPQIPGIDNSVHSDTPTDPQVDMERKGMGRWVHCLMDTEHVQVCWGSWMTYLQSTQSSCIQLGPRSWPAEAEPELFPAPSFA